MFPIDSHSNGLRQKQFIYKAKSIVAINENINKFVNRSVNYQLHRSQQQNPTSINVRGLIAEKNIVVRNEYTN